MSEYCRCGAPLENGVCTEEALNRLERHWGNLRVAFESSAELWPVMAKIFWLFREKAAKHERAFSVMHSKVFWEAEKRRVALKGGKQ